MFVRLVVLEIKNEALLVPCTPSQRVVSGARPLGVGSRRRASRAPRVRGYLFVIVGGLVRGPTVGVRADGWFAPTVRRHQTRPFPLFRRRDVFHPLSAEGGGKILPQTRTRASRCKSIKLPRSSASQERPSWPGRVSPGARGASSQVQAAGQ